jgi:hypothetical protein
MASSSGRQRLFCARLTWVSVLSLLAAQIASGQILAIASFIYTVYDETPMKSATRSLARLYGKQRLRTTDISTELLKLENLLYRDKDGLTNLVVNLGNSSITEEETKALEKLMPRLTSDRQFFRFGGCRPSLETFNQKVSNFCGDDEGPSTS